MAPQLVRGVDAGALDERAYQRFASQMDYSRLTDASDVPLPPAPARGPARLSGATLEAAEGYLAGRRALSGWELGPRGESAAQHAVDREQARACDAQETLKNLLKMTGRRSRPKRRPEDNEPVPGARGAQDASARGGGAGGDGDANAEDRRIRGRRCGKGRRRRRSDVTEAAAARCRRDRDP